MLSEGVFARPEGQSCNNPTIGGPRVSRSLCQYLDCLTNADDGGLATRELLNRLQVAQRRHAGKGREGGIGVDREVSGVCLTPCCALSMAH